MLSRRIPSILVVALLGLAGSSAHAQMFVEAVQFPAWLERRGLDVPLRPGLQLEPGDRVRTGDGARAQLRLSEGSTVKLGERAQFSVERMEDRGILKATLSVIAGAFRFTSQAARQGAVREVSVKVKNVSIGIRGTDVWGKSSPERDLACLIEGRITVGAEGHPTVTLEQPLDFYEKPANADPRVARVDLKQLEEWARETEPQDAGPVARGGGKWTVVAGKYTSRDGARLVVRTLRERGYPAELAGGEGGEPYRVRIRGLVGEPQARELMASIRDVPGLGIPFISDLDLR
jgi:hypothetical protein